MKFKIVSLKNASGRFARASGLVHQAVVQICRVGLSTSKSAALRPLVQAAFLCWKWIMVYCSVSCAALVTSNAYASSMTSTSDECDFLRYTSNGFKTNNRTCFQRQKKLYIPIFEGSRIVVHIFTQTSFNIEKA